MTIKVLLLVTRKKLKESDCVVQNTQMCVYRSTQAFRALDFFLNTIWSRVEMVLIGLPPVANLLLFLIACSSRNYLTLFMY